MGPLVMNIVVVGAGPTGLAAAYRLATKGHYVQILERRPSFAHGPGSIQIPINGNNILTSWSLGSEFDALASKKRLMYMERYSDLNRLCTLITEEGSARWVVHRDDLQQILARKAIDAGVQVLFNKEVVQIDVDEGTLRCSDDAVFLADLIIGADGLRSIVREKMFPSDDTTPDFTSTICYQTMIPEKVMNADPQLQELYEDGQIHAIMGPGCYIVTWSQYARNEYYVGILDARADQRVGKAMAQPLTDEDIAVRLDEILSHFAAPIKRIASSESKWIPWHIAQGKSKLGYVNPNGKIVLVGDAGHSMTPDAAQGFSQGLEDVEALSTLLEYAKLDNVTRVVKAYEELRKPRASRMQAFAASNAPVFAFEDGPNQEARDKRLGEIDEAQGKVNFKEVVPDINATFVEPAFRKWMIEYDVRQEAQKLARKLRL